MTARSNLINAIAANLSVDKAAAEKALNAVAAEIKSAVATTGRIALPGFGTFEKKQKKETKAKNMATGEAMVVPAHGYVAFRPAGEFKQLVK